MNGGKVSRTKDVVLKDSEEVTRCRNPKGENVLLHSRRLYIYAEFGV